jgi:peptidoglycan/LPS O-acetylase OafA/YrhL
MDAVLGDPLLHPDWYSLWHLPSGTRPPRTSMPLCSGFRGCCCCRRRMGRFSNALRLAVNPGPHLPRGFVGLPFWDRIPATPLTLAVCAGMTLVIAGTGFAPSLIHLPLCVLFLAGSLYLPLAAVGSRYDVSYGVYIYGWPVQQFLASMGLHTVVPPLAFAGASLLVVAPLAWLSCRHVEGPAQRWRRSRDTRRRVAELA